MPESLEERCTARGLRTGYDADGRPVGWWKPAVSSEPRGCFRLEFVGTPEGPGVRPDPVLTWAMTTLAADKQARLAGARAVVGRVEVAPNTVGVVAERVTAWLETEAGSAEAAVALVAAIVHQGAQRALRDGTLLEVTGGTATAVLNPGLPADQAAAALVALGVVPADLLPR